MNLLDEHQMAGRLIKNLNMLLLENSAKYFLFIQFLGAEEPVVASHFSFGLHTFFSHATGAGGGNDDLIAGLPVGKGGDREGISGLQGDNHRVEFIEVASQTQRIVDDRADLK